MTHFSNQNMLGFFVLFFTIFHWIELYFLIVDEAKEKTERSCCPLNHPGLQSLASIPLSVPPSLPLAQHDNAAVM